MLGIGRQAAAQGPLVVQLVLAAIGRVLSSLSKTATKPSGGLSWLMASVAQWAQAGYLSRRSTPGAFPSPCLTVRRTLGISCEAPKLTTLRRLHPLFGGVASSKLAVATHLDFLIVKREGRQSVSVWGYPFTPLFYVIVTLVLAGIAGARERMQLLAAVVTIVSGSAVYYAFGLHKVASPIVVPGGRAPHH